MSMVVLPLSPWQWGRGTFAFFFRRRGVAAVGFQPRWTSMLGAL